LPYTFNWSNGATTEDLTALSEGTYNVIVTDANGCSVNSSATVTNQAGDLHLTWGNATNEICGNSSGTIDILIEGGNPFGGGGPFGGGYYEYLWSNGSTTEDLVNISEGSYSCVVTDEDGCQITTPVYVVENEAGTLAIDDIDLDNEICNNGLGEIELIISGGTTPYNFSWNTGQTTQDIFNLSAGTYNNTITDANGCSVFTGDLILINESGTLALENIEVVDELCNNNSGEIDITITGGTTPYNFIWNTGSSDEDLNGLDAGNYSCEITDANGCLVSVNSTVNDDNGTIAVSNIIITDENCGNADGTVDITISGAANPVNFDWNNGATTEDITNLSAGTYNCIVTDAIGCETNANAVVDNNSGDLELTNSIVTNEQCGGSNGSINIVVAGSATPLTFNWTNGATTEDIDNLSAGVYSCTITDANGCSINAGPYNINNTSSTMSVTAVDVTNETCGSGNGAINLTISGGEEPITFAWSNGATTEDISGLSAGIYNYTITDNSSCSISGSAEVINDAGNLEITSFTKTDEICGNANGAIDITVNGAAPFNFAWSNGATTEDVSGLIAGTYNVTINDNNGCEITSSEYNVLNDAGAFTLTSISTIPEHCNDATGSINAEVANGTEPINYLWNNSETTQDISGLSEGVYSCLATDANGCELNYFATVENIEGNITISNETLVNETCGNSNGSIDIEITGGTEPYIFAWNNGETTEDLTDIEAGDYNCVITDNEGCSTNYSATIEDIGGDFAIINVEVIDEHCDNEQGEIDVTITGGTEPYTFAWDNGATTEDLTGLLAGTYNLTVTETTGCEVQTSAEVLDVANAIIITNADITDENCGNNEGAIDITYTGANEPASFAWSNGATTEDISSLASGNYDLTITDLYGCSISESYFVDNFTNGFELQNIDVTDEACGNSDGAIDITITGGDTPYSFVWSNGSTNEDISNLSAGTYTCEITDNTGCIINISADVINNANGLAVTLESITNDECASSNGSINITPSGGSNPYTFLWNNGTTSEDLNNITAGIYFITITDDTGCSTTSESFTVENDENEDLAIVNIYTEPDFCGDGFGLINYEAAVSGSYVYELDGVPGVPPFDNLTAGDYVISIVDGYCRVDETVTVESDGFFNINIDNVQNEICGQQNGLIEISTGGGGGGGGGSFTYAWSNGETTQDIYNLPADDYSCEITHVNSGCVQTMNQTITNVVTFTASSEKTDETCGNSNGAIDVTINPAGTYTFAWSNGESTEDLTDISAGTYTCTITDNSACSDVITEVIVDNSNNITISGNIQDNVCGQSVGSIDLTISGAPVGYSVLWNTGATTDFLHDIPTGTYTVTVTDLEFSCEEFRSYDVGETPSYDVSEIITNSSCETCNDGAIDITPNPAGTYTFDWSNGETTEDISGLLPGEYSVIVSNDNGCEFEGTYTVEYSNLVNNIENMLINVYPNPTSGILTIDYNSIKEKSVVRIVNVIGVLLYENTITDNEGSIEIDISRYSAGIYYLTIGNKEQQKTIKIFKQSE